MLRGLGSIDVGYVEPPVIHKAGSDQSQHGGKAPPGGLDKVAARHAQKFDPDNKPRFPSEPDDGMASYETIALQHRDLTARAVYIVNKNPALYVLVAIDANKAARAGGSDAVSDVKQDVGAARAMIAAALTEISENITKTKAALDGNSLGFESLQSVHEKFYATHKQWSHPFARAAAKGVGGGCRR